MFGQNIIKRPLFYGAGGGSGTINSTGSCGGCSYCRPTKKKKDPSPLEQLAEQAEEETVEESIEPEYSGSVSLRTASSAASYL